MRDDVVPAPDWRSAADYEYVSRLTYIDLAWEFLRRNSDCWRADDDRNRDRTFGATFGEIRHAPEGPLRTRFLRRDRQKR